MGSGFQDFDTLARFTISPFEIATHHFPHPSQRRKKSLRSFPLSINPIQNQHKLIPLASSRILHLLLSQFQTPSQQHNQRTNMFTSTLSQTLPFILQPQSIQKPPQNFRKQMPSRNAFGTSNNRMCHSYL